LDGLPLPAIRTNGNMKKLTLIILIVTIISTANLLAQDITLKDKALSEFKNEHYDEAIKLLEKVLEETKDDAEIYYYLGFFNHYQAYDSRPLNGYDFSYSERIFQYLNKAIELNPNYGDAKYFYGAECSANAFNSMQDYNLKQLKYFYKLAFEKGAYPDWLIEFGKNMLNTCDTNAILFTGGNADFDVCSYLQLQQDFRTDITVIPIGNIDRPWYVKFLKQGLEGGVKKITINLTDNQIFDIHPFKWDTTKIEIPVSASTLRKYNLEKDYKMFWTIEPDLFSSRKHSKIEKEKIKYRTYLSPQRAILLQIIEDNFQNRPIFFSNISNTSFFGGLDRYFKYCGLVSELTPMITKHREYEYDYRKIEELLSSENFKKFATIKKTDIPRISRIVFTYHRTVLILANYYSSNKQKVNFNKLKEFYFKYLAIGFNEDYENMYQAEIEKMENKSR